MSATGKYPKGVEKQSQLVDVALKVVADRGYNAATIREVAEAADLSKGGLLHHFRDKESLFAEVIRRRDDLATQAWVDGRLEPSNDPAEFISGFVRRNAEVPGLVQLFTRLSAEATDPGHPAHAFFAERYEANQLASAALFRELQDEGRVDDTVDANALAIILAALEDGLQQRWLYEPDIDMADHVFAFLNLIVRPERDKPGPQ